MQLFDLVAQGEANGPTLASAIKAALAGQNLDRLDVAVAYATRSGLTALRNAADGFPEASRWVVGLDDAITQPQALKDLIALPNSVVRLASLSAEGRRFHPKIYCFWSTQDAAVCVCIIGSANMTLHGLNRNGETAVILVAENAKDAEALKSGWNSMWALGKDATAERVDAYREFHAKARKAQRRLEKIGAVPTQPEAEEPLTLFDGKPDTGSLLFVDFGSAMGNGSEIELPKIVVSYFGIADGTPSPQIRNFAFAGGVVIPIPVLRRQNNGMWRITFGANVPGTALLKRKTVAGVKQRSDMAVVFQRTEAGSYQTAFVKIGTPQYTALTTETQNEGTFGRTRQGPAGKNYGFR
jgi:HKD family nuclease